ncbi:MAG: EamA family transporter [Acidobacteriaceae bacterium]|nr:EamA family transporter [Acidobacteriaceae bacterium]
MQCAAVALAAAVAWGGGDFSGGMGTKGSGGSVAAALRVIMLANLSSLVLLVLVSWLTGAPRPTGAAALWAIAAGVLAGVSVTAFYMALARGEMGPSAAVSGLLAAAIPAAVSAVLDGAPGVLRLAGFALAAIAIWTIATGNHHDAPGTMPLAVVGGLGFGLYFTALRLSNPLGVWESMALARAASILTCGILWLLVRAKQPGQAVLPKLSGAAWGWVAGVAVLDTTGNLCFVEATRLGRLDVTAVLGSLYPAGTILLAAAVLKERPARKQWLGMLVALAAVVLVSL